MEARRLGYDGPWVSPLWLGTWPLGGGMGKVDRRQAISTIRHAVALGITAIDTAEGYGDAEELIGEAIRASERHTVYLATKVSFGPYTQQRVRDAAEQSLRRMRTDHLDLLQLHFYPDGVSLPEALDSLAAVREDGLVADVGLSNFTGDQLADALRSLRPRSAQVPLNLFDRDELTGAIPQCRSTGVGVICHSTLAKGLLTGKLDARATFGADDERARNARFAPGTLERYLDAAARIEAVASAAGLTLVEFAVAWSLAQPGVTACIAGPVMPHELDGQIRGAAAALPADAVEAAGAIAAGAPAIGHGTPTRSPALPH